MTVLSTISPDLSTRIATNSAFTAVFDADLLGSSVNKQNIIFEFDGNPVDYTISNSPADTIVITPVNILLTETIYELTFTAGILDSGSNPITPVTLKFITETLESYNDIVSDTLGRNNLDMFNTNKNEIGKLLDVDFMMSDRGSDLNFSYNPTTFDPDTKLYTKDKSVIINFDIQELFKEKFKGQYLENLTGYLEKIEELNTLTTTEYNDILRFLYTNSYEIATSSGIKTQIESLLKIYGYVLDRNFVDVQPDPIEPFVYHIVTYIGTEHWNGILKDMLHPISWKEHFREVPNYIYTGTDLGDFTVNVTTDVMTFTTPNLIDDTIVTIHAPVEMPTGLSGSISYYVIDSSTNTFKLSLTLDGSAVDFSDDGSGSFACHDEDGNNHRITVDNTTDTITLTIPSIEDDVSLHLESTDTLPLGLSKNTRYWVVNSAGNTFQLASIQGGTEIEVKDNGTGIHTVRKFQNIDTDQYDWTNDYLTDFLDDNEKDEVLDVLNSTKYMSIWPMSYLRAQELGRTLFDSKFFDHGDFTIGFDFFPGTVNQWTIGDTTYEIEETLDILTSLYKPLVSIESQSYLTTTFQFGVVTFFHDTHFNTTQIVSATDFTINSITQNADNVNWEDIVVSGGLTQITDISVLGELIFYETDGVTQVTNGASNPVPGLIIKQYNYGTSTITVDTEKDDGSGNWELEPGSGGDAVYFNYATPDIKKILTCYIPITLSFDINLWFGFYYIFELGYVDVKDYEDWMEFKTTYSIESAIIELPLDSDGPFITSLSVATLYEVIEEKDTYTRYTLSTSDSNANWVSGDYIYEFSVVVTGTCDADTTNKLVDSTADFVSDGIAVNFLVFNTTDSTIGYVKAIDSLTTLSIKDGDGDNLDLFPLGTESYVIIEDTATGTQIGSVEHSTSALYGTSDTDTTNKLIDSTMDFISKGVNVDDLVSNITDNTIGYVKAIDSATTLSIKDIGGNDLDLFPDGDENYVIAFSTSNMVLRFHNPSFTFTPGYYYWKESRYHESIINNRNTFDRGSYFTVESETFTNKITIGYNHPSFDSYVWTEAEQSGTPYKIQHTYDNMFVFFCEGTIVYDVSLDLEWVTTGPVVNNTTVSPVIINNLNS